MVKLLRRSAVPLIRPCLWILSQEPSSTNSGETDTPPLRALCLPYRILSLALPPVQTPALSIFSTALRPTTPLFAFQQQPTEILMNPVWPLIAVSASSWMFLQRGTAPICLLTRPHVGWAAHDGAVGGVLCSPPVMNLVLTLLPAGTGPLNPLHGYTDTSHTYLSWFIKHHVLHGGL